MPGAAFWRMASWMMESTLAILLLSTDVFLRGSPVAGKLIPVPAGRDAQTLTGKEPSVDSAPLSIFAAAS